MKTYQQKLNYAKLELIYSQPRHSEAKTYILLPRLKQIWHDFLELWTLNPEPRIWEEIDQSGKMFWRVYDPKRDRTLKLDTKEQVLAWLEERYHQQPTLSSWNNDW
jgi:hypothetical protein